MKYIITDISWDTDGEDVDLPEEMEIDVPDDLNSYEEIEEYISDKLSEETGFCHLGFSTTPEIKQ